MKKLTAIILALALTLSAAFCLSGCDKEPVDGKAAVGGITIGP